MQKPKLQTANGALVSEANEELNPGARLKDMRQAEDEERYGNQFFDRDVHSCGNVGAAVSAANPVAAVYDRRL